MCEAKSPVMEGVRHDPPGSTPSRARPGSPTQRVGGMGSGSQRNPRTCGPLREAEATFAPAPRAERR